MHNRRRWIHPITPYSRIGHSTRPAEVRSGVGDAITAAGKHIQPDTPAPLNLIATATSWLKVVGRREYNNVM